MRPILQIALLLALAGPAAAQTDDQANGPASSGPCQAEPQGQAQKPQADSGSNTEGGLSGKLAPCGGVLRPPPTGDQGMAQPAPDEGNTPVIKPGQVPVQPPKQ